MSTIAIAQMTITNPENLAAYREKAAAALAKHGGEIIQASGDVVAIEGDPTVPNIIAVVQFPDQAAVLAWKNDPSLQDVHALRMNSGKSEIVCL